MTQQLAIDQVDAALVAAVPHPAALQELNIYTHSTLLYWWAGLGVNTREIVVNRTRTHAVFEKCALLLKS
jgi:hypothetical protein